jgi:hypothetical protein
MTSDDERIGHEVLAASIEWGLDPPQSGSDISDDHYLAPEAAVIVLDTMVAHFAWLSEWIDLARKSAIAAAAVELARMNDAPKSLRIALTQSADEARMKLEGSDIPNGVNARQVLESFAKLQRVAARKPDLYL